MLSQTIFACALALVAVGPTMWAHADDNVEQTVSRLSQAVKSLLENRDDATLKAIAINELAAGVEPFVRDHLNHEGLRNLNTFLRDARIRYGLILRNKTQVPKWSHEQILQKLALAREHFYPAIREAFETGSFEPHLISIDGVPAYAYLADLAKQLQMLGFDMHYFFDGIEATLTGLWDAKRPVITTTPIFGSD